MPNFYSMGKVNLTIFVWILYSNIWSNLTLEWVNETTTWKNKKKIQRQEGLYKCWCNSFKNSVILRPQLIKKCYLLCLVKSRLVQSSITDKEIKAHQSIEILFYSIRISNQLGSLIEIKSSYDSCSLVQSNH